MKPSLEALPIELIEHIVTFLELDDIASLRLTSRTIENDASQGSFTALFKHKNVELTMKTLQKMERVTSQGRLGCLLRHCTITGILRNKKAAAAAAYKDIEYSRVLAAAFGNLKRRTGMIASLRLSLDTRGEIINGEPIHTDDFRSWRTVWETALCTFHVTMDALNSSQLPVIEHLDIFGSLRACSLGCDAFLTLAPKFLSTHVFESLKRLTVSLSAPHEAVKENANGSNVYENIAPAQSRLSEPILQDIMQVSRIMPKLEGLEIHWFNLGQFDVNSEVSSVTCHDSGARLPPPSLKECTLRGLYVSESDLLQFLNAVRPVALTLTDIRLVSGTYTAMSRFLTGPESPVTYYQLDDIREGGNLVHFNMPGRPKFPYRYDRVGPSSLTRRNSQVKEAIRYRFASGRPLGSPARARWVKEKAREFGPPNHQCLYNLIEMNHGRL
ncbi:MAG: hypothetical protein M1821_006220 [Bathelium mastoideum]|nr:MAG: hypothetical protein M1821_006220 [Bathelium mastoideum]